MRANLVRGKLVAPPRSMLGAISRLKQLQHEVTRIDEQLKDSARTDETWRKRALGARKLFLTEVQQVQSWIDRQGVLANLLASAHAVLAEMREDGVEFSVKDELVFRRMNEYLTTNDVIYETISINKEEKHG